MNKNYNNIFKKLTGGKKPSYDEQNYHNGITRIKKDNEFFYFYIKDKKPASQKDLDRIKKLKIPPAWENLWVSIDAKSDIQAIGVDEKGRKQYRYNEKHIEEAEKEKFLRLYDFIRAIPKLEKIMKEHSKLDFYNKKRVIVTMLQIVKLVHMRVGKEQYARENKSYGISSLKKSHLKIINDIIRFNFKGKSRKQLSYTLRNKDIQNHLELLLKLEGDKLFQYIDENNKIHIMNYKDLNEYIQEFMGKDFSIKDFRTYAANYYFIKNLLSETNKRTPNTEKAIKKNISNAIKTTAYYMKHTKSISKKSYIMSFCIEMYEDNPELFVEYKNEDPDDFLIEILKMYKNKLE